MRLHGHVREPIVCTVALDIASWYGSSDVDGPWQLTGAEESLDGAVMMPAKGTMNLRDELERFGVRDCVLDVQPAAR